VSDEQCNNYFSIDKGRDESVCASTLNKETKHAKVSLLKVIKCGYQETTSSSASCATQDVEEEFENFGLQKPKNINGYSKDDFKKALVDLQHHVENQEIELEKLNRKIPTTQSPFDEDFDAGTLIIEDSAVDAAQEAVLDILPVGVDNAAIELTDQNDTSLLTIAIPSTEYA
jgi:hypothetical protein